MDQAARIAELEAENQRLREALKLALPGEATPEDEAQWVLRKAEELLRGKRVVLANFRLNMGRATQLTVWSKLEGEGSPLPRSYDGETLANAYLAIP